MLVGPPDNPPAQVLAPSGHPAKCPRNMTAAAEVGFEHGKLRGHSVTSRTQASSEIGDSLEREKLY